MSAKRALCIFCIFNFLEEKSNKTFYFKPLMDKNLYIALIIWLALQAGKMKPILCSDCLPKQARRPILSAQDFPLCSHKSEILWCNLLAIIIINPLLNKPVQSRWLDIDFVLFSYIFVDRVSVHKITAFGRVEKFIN